MLLSPNERRYLESGEAPATYRKSQLEKQVKKKAQDAIDKFLTLLEHIESLSEEGYINEESRRENFKEFSKDTIYNPEPELSNSGGVEEGSTPHSRSFKASSEREMGRKLAGVFNNLFPERGRDAFIECLWGFISTHEHLRQVPNEKAPNYIENLGLDLKKKAEQSLNEWESLKNSHNQVSEIIKDEFELPQSEGSLEDVHGALLVVTQEEPSIGEVAFFEREIIKNVKEKRPTSEKNPVDLAIKENQIAERHRLKNIIESDAEELKKKSWRGTEAKDVLLSIVKGEGLTEKNVWGKLINDLKKEGKDPWNGYKPLVKGEGDSLSATDYGKLLALNITERYDPISQLWLPVSKAEEVEKNILSDFQEPKPLNKCLEDRKPQEVLKNIIYPSIKELGNS